MTYDRDGLVAHIRNSFRLDWESTHGWGHWARVEHHAKTVAAIRGGDVPVAELFALLHDSCREDEFEDEFHGEWGAEFTRSLNGLYFDLELSRLDLLCFAIRDHSKGYVSGDATIQSCWDGDRLDLGRIGRSPLPKYLSAEAALMIEQAYEWSVSGWISMKKWKM